MNIIDVKRTGNIVIIANNDYSVEFDAIYGEKGYPFICNLYNIKLTEELISEIESSKIVQVDTDLCTYIQSKPDPVHYPTYEYATELYLIPKFGYSTEKITEILYTIIKRMCHEVKEHV